jgi:hypothetical protein
VSDAERSARFVLDGEVISAGDIAPTTTLLQYLRDNLGGEAAQMQLSLPASVTGLFQGVLLFYLLAADLFINFRLRRSAHPRGAPELPAALACKEVA